MKETEFKVLMHCGNYVDANLLHNGIYACVKPFIYFKEETIESIIDRCVNINATTGGNFISESYIENLRQCQLALISITPIINN